MALRSTTPEAYPPPQPTYAPAETGEGWRAFAGIMIIVGGLLNFIDGLIAVTNANYFQHLAAANGTTVSLPITNDIKTWGWVVLFTGAVMVATGVGVFGGYLWARVLGVVAASFNIVVQLAFLAHYPLWSLIMLLVDVLVIYGIVVHGQRERRSA